MSDRAKETIETGPLGPTRRRRRTAESAREEILEAARTRLMDDGPEGLRLKTIAADVGISHSAILHHFGSREGLMKVLRDDAFAALARDLKRRMAELPESGDPSIDFFETIAETLGEGGFGKMLAWQIMVGPGPERASVGQAVFGPDESVGLLSGVARLLHDLRIERARASGHREPELDETRALTAMIAFTLLGESIAGEVLVRSAGLGETPEDRKAFRNWFARIAHHLSFDGQTPASNLSKPD